MRESEGEEEEERKREKECLSEVKLYAWCETKA